MRGEYNYGGNPPTWNQGSPPLARGIQCGCAVENVQPGITPACAGNTSQPACWNRSQWDHPRLRGEYMCLNFRIGYEKGSPPLARGIPPRTVRCTERPGITPACAGNTVPELSSRSRNGDHPRLRGEYAIISIGKEAQQGSPPLARGIH